MLQNPDSLDFTSIAEETFYDTVDDPRFQSNDQALIYDALLNALHPLTFGDYLKRYVYQKAQLKEPYDLIPITLFQDIIVDAFRDTMTPASFTPGTTTLKAQVKNWLTRKTVSRQAVLLLGFGLGMSVDDVNMFLTKALREHRLSPKDPDEVICTYCYNHHFGFPKYESLIKQLHQNSLHVSPLSDQLNSTVKLASAAFGVQTDAALLTYLAQLQETPGASTQGLKSRQCFDRLYEQARKSTAAMYNAMKDDYTDIQISRQRDLLSRDDRLYDYQKDSQLQRMADGQKNLAPEDIGPADIEKIICAAVPIGKGGNYLPLKESTLNDIFEGKRFNRKHIGDVLSGASPVTRFDLITLSFYNHALDLSDDVKPIVRYRRFIESTDAILNTASMGALYVANPYECFILMCMLSDDPLGTYADVWERSYQTEET